MQITEVILTPAEFALIQRVLTTLWNDRNIDREVKEAEGLKPLIDGLNLLRGASAYVIRPVRTLAQQA